MVIQHEPKGEAFAARLGQPPKSDFVTVAEAFTSTPTTKPRRFSMTIFTSFRSLSRKCENSTV